MSSLYEIIKSLQTTQGNNAKLAILEANKDNELLKQYMKAIFDPSISYYMTKLPKQKGDAMTTMDVELINWLITNIAGRVFTGKIAEARLKGVMSCLDDEGLELLDHIIQRKIAGSNVGETMVLKTWPNLFFIPAYMRCKSMDKKVREHYSKLPYFIVQLKADCSFAYLQKTREGVCKAITRQGSLYPSWFAEKMLKGVPEGIVVVGEMQVYQAIDDSEYELLDRKTGNGILNSVLQGGDESEFSEYEFVHVAWDMLTEEEFVSGKSNRKYEDRFSELVGFTEDYSTTILLVDYWIVHSIKEANEIHTKLTSEGKEGTVWKTPDGLWKDTDSGTIDQVKNKVVFDCDLEILGYFEGQGKYAGMFGGFTVGTSDGKIVNDVGTGFSDKQRKEFWERIKEDANAFIGGIVALEANDVIDSKSKTTLSLSLPVFIEVRNDKRVADSYERVMEQFQAAKEGRIN